MFQINKKYNIITFYIKNKNYYNNNLSNKKLKYY